MGALPVTISRTFPPRRACGTVTRHFERASAAAGDTHLDFGKNEAVPQLVLHEAALEPLLLGADCHLEQAGLDAACLPRAVVDLVEDAVEEAGDGWEDGGCELLQVLRDLLNVALEETDGSPGVKQGNLRQG